MIDNRHPQTTTLTLLLMAEQNRSSTFEEATHEVLARYFEDMMDEQKSDLYALLAENVKAEMRMSEMQSVVNRCLWDNTNNWAKRYG